MKKFLALTLLICSSSQAVDWWSKLAVPATVLACGEVLYQLKANEPTRSGCKSIESLESRAVIQDVATMAAGFAAMNVLDQKEVNIQNVLGDAVVSYAALSAAKSETVNHLLSSVPGVRGIFGSKHSDDVSSMARYTVCLMACKAVWEGCKSALTKFSADPKNAVEAAKSVATK